MSLDRQSFLYASVGSSYSNLECTLGRHGGKSVEIKLVNLDYAKQRLSKIKLLLKCLVLYICYLVVATSSSTPITRSYFIDTLFGGWLVCIAISAFSMVKSEHLLFCPHFALQLRTEYFWSRFYNNFIPVSNIYDVCINEVVEHLSICYVLIVRTKGALYEQKPVIPIFHSLKPSLACLEEVYCLLMKVMEDTENPDVNATDGNRSMSSCREETQLKQ